ncbi:hypothetical protein KNO15_00035 [Leifsonia shinshuensis]|uniref:hypothetical protein n=1 Tax=Leifsonia shinshuensis TaxID=150026 RepID=UPI001F50FAC0|nr:hypothetical protein [Leifsonia shinshuensis]MCI0155091.1 hypothetical protein [Leifsonia shinshuensis]
MRLRSLLAWLPSGLVVAAATVGIAVMRLDSTSGEGTFLVGESSGTQLGLTLLLVAVPLAVVALGQLCVMAGRLRSNWAPFVVRLLAAAVIVALMPAGALLLLAAGLAATTSYSHLEVPGRDIVARENTWRHPEIDFLERRGLLYVSLPACALPVGTYNAFAHGEYDVTTVAGRTILRYASTPGGERIVPLDLSIGWDDLARVCGVEPDGQAPTGSPRAPAAPPS